MNSLRSRMDKIVYLFPRERCPGCGDHPSRIVQIDGHTNTVVSESMPADGCPVCGRLPFRTYEIIGSAGDAPVATLV